MKEKYAHFKDIFTDEYFSILEINVGSTGWILYRRHLGSFPTGETSHAAG